MATVLATPGVYIEEKSAFSSSVVGIATAIPAFIGYTAKALRGTKSLINVPTKVTSMGEFEELFGAGPKTKFEITADETAPQGYTVGFEASSRFMLYNALRLFFANGGGNCYIVSVGDYKNGIKAKDFNNTATGAGIPALEKYLEPTLLVIPEAVLLSKNDCYSLQQAMLLHCGFKMRNRFAILDVFNGDKDRTLAEDDVVNQFREGLGNNFLQWGAAYYPYVKTTIVAASELNFTNVANSDVLVELLSKEVADALEAGAISQARSEAITAEIAKMPEATKADDIISLQATLMVISPKLKGLIGQLSEMMNVMPPSAAMAGIYAMVDSSINVAKSPANVSLGSVVAPVVNINQEAQEELNVPLNGKAVNAIRSFTGKGVLVWGARTLEGNSQDWRYLSVRRTMIFLEQSIKFAAESYVFDPNNSTTWSTLKATVTNFLKNQWQSGILAGAAPEDAFSVEIGLGSTMTANDILDGILKMTIKVAITRPAEFIVITFQQQQQKS